jgi:Sulfotransferase family
MELTIGVEGPTRRSRRGSFGRIRRRRRFCVFEAEALCAAARRRNSLEDFGDPPLEPALSTLLNSLEEEASLHRLGRFLLYAHLQEILETRLRLACAWQGTPNAFTTSRIERPIFITGMPRSGSTFLHELLAQDSDNRSPQVWEVMFPLPAPELRGSIFDSRRLRTAARLWWFRRLAPQVDEVYPMRACSPHERVAIHSFTFLSEEFVSTCRVPSYEAFLRSTDLVPAYAWEKRFLQHLQSRSRTKRWVLKAPDHVHGLEELFSVFPDALIIQTHRDPLAVLGSDVQLTRVLQSLYARPSDLSELRARATRVLAEMEERCRRFRDRHPELANRFVDLDYSELVSDPVTAIRRIYWQFEIPLIEPTIERVRHLASKRSRYVGQHNLSLKKPPAKSEPCDRPGISKQDEPIPQTEIDRDVSLRST